MGKNLWCRSLVQQVQLWSEMETEQGHDLGKSDLYTHFVRLLDSAVAFGTDAEAAGTITPEEADELKQSKPGSEQGQIPIVFRSGTWWASVASQTGRNSEPQL